MVDTRASYPSGQSGLPLRPAPGVSGSTVLDPAAPQPLGAGVQATRVAAVPVSAPRPVVRPYRPSLWGEKPHAVALLGTLASICVRHSHVRAPADTFRFNAEALAGRQAMVGFVLVSAREAPLTRSAAATCVLSIACVQSTASMPVCLLPSTIQEKRDKGTPGSACHSVRL